jgi:hypothetical protein
MHDANQARLQAAPNSHYAATVELPPELPSPKISRVLRSYRSPSISTKERPPIARRGRPTTLCVRARAHAALELVQQP